MYVFVIFWYVIMSANFHVLLFNAMLWLQTTQLTCGGAVTAVLISCCANYVETSRPQQWGSNLPCLVKPAIRTRCMSGLRTRCMAGCREKSRPNNNTHTQVWICDICHKQIHGRKPISIMCNMIEHWMHLRCAIYRYKSSTRRIRTHTSHRHNTTPPFQTLVNPPTHSPPTPPQPKHTSNTPPVPTGLVKHKPNTLIHSPPHLQYRPEPNTYTFHTHSTNPSHP